jgi:hypothetical protein
VIDMEDGHRESVIPGRRAAASPESITPVIIASGAMHITRTGDMDSGSAPSARPGMTEK